MPRLLARHLAKGPLCLWRRSPSQQRKGGLSGGMAGGVGGVTRPVHLLRGRGVRRLLLEPPAALVPHGTPLGGRETALRAGASRTGDARRKELILRSVSHVPAAAAARMPFRSASSTSAPGSPARRLL